MSPELIFEGMLPVASISIENRLRPATEAGVESLMASVQQLGVMKDPVQVRRVGGAKARDILIAGMHRVEVAKRLGWEEVPVKVWTCSADWARMMEIDDNLAGAEMDALELALFMAERKSVYERLHPETVKGRAGAEARWNATDIVSFASSAAEKRGLSERQIRRLVSIGSKLGDHRDALFAMKTRPSQKDLLEFAGVDSPEQRGRAIDLFAKGEAPNAKDAIKAVIGKAPSLTNAQKSEHRLYDAWDRASIAQRRAFVADHAEQLLNYLKTETENAA